MEYLNGRSINFLIDFAFFKSTVFQLLQLLIFDATVNLIHCAKPPFPGRPSSWCPRHEGAAPPLLRGEGLVYSTICFEGLWPGVTWPLGGGEAEETFFDTQEIRNLCTEECRIIADKLTIVHVLTTIKLSIDRREGATSLTCTLSFSAFLRYRLQWKRISTWKNVK